MTIEHPLYTIGRGYGRKAASQTVAALVFLSAAAAATAAPQTAVPAGYQPGWQVTVRRAGDALDQPTGGVVTQFTAPATGFDMGSYRHNGGAGFDYGLAYDAQGLLNIGKAGSYRFTVTVGWGRGVPGPESSCRMSLALDGHGVAEWKGPLSILAGERTQQASIDLESGLHPAQLRIACDGPVDSRVSAVLEMKAPDERDLRPLGPADIVHAGEDPTPAIAGSAAPQTEAPPPGETPTGDAAAAGNPAGPPPNATAQQGETLPPGGTTMIASTGVIVRDQPNRYGRRLGRLAAGEAVEVAGATPDGSWMRLAQGGFVQASFLRAPGDAGAAPDSLPPPPPPPGAHYRVGECRPYTIPGSPDRRQPDIQGEACLQANGTWQVVR